ncbi:hypothetical protein BgiMline_010428 [Biomphalaria glabrata]|nr:hypothetical protein BgiMline_024156 [Biomphalaria glabrata]
MEEVTDEGDQIGGQERWIGANSTQRISMKHETEETSIIGFPLAEIRVDEFTADLKMKVFRHVKDKCVTIEAYTVNMF